ELGRVLDQLLDQGRRDVIETAHCLPGQLAHLNQLGLHVGQLALGVHPSSDRQSHPTDEVSLGLRVNAQAVADDQFKLLTELVVHARGPPQLLTASSSSSSSGSPPSGGVMLIGAWVLAPKPNGSGLADPRSF